MGTHITDYLLYRRRYIIGYTLIGVMVVWLLAVAAFLIPGGLSKAEMGSVVMSDAIKFSLNAFDPHTVINLPYHLLQRLSIALFGVTTGSIKLPSLILGALSVLGMILLLKTWFRQNVAILSTIIVVTTGQFLFMAQSGTSSIIYIFWSIWLLVAAMKVSRRAKWSWVWKVVLFVLAALSLYTPLSVYILIALITAVILHPHLRYVVRRLSKLKILFAAVCALIIITPLAYVCFRHPSIGLTLLGIPSAMPDIPANAMKLLNQYFNFTTAGSTVPVTPIYGLGSIILIGLGILRLITTKYTARSYIITAWVVLLIPALLINPNFVSVTFVPGVLLLAMGVSTLIAKWYTLFPRNPYARIAGLVPLAILIAGMVFSGIDRYTYGYLYNPQVAQNFSKDLRLLNTQLSDKSRGSTQLIVSTDETAFYSVVARHNEDITVGPSSITSPAKTIIVSHAAYRTSSFPTPYRIVADGKTQDGDRFYIYKTNTK